MHQNSQGVQLHCMLPFQITYDFSPYNSNSNNSQEIRMNLLAQKLDDEISK